MFKPYAGVSTAIIIFTKTTVGGTDNVWFYDMQADGFSLDDKRQPLKDKNDIPDILQRWKSLENEKNRVRIEKSFFVPVKEIQDNNYDLSINRYKEVIHEEKIYESSSVIIKHIRQLDEERNALLTELEGLLGDKTV